MIAKRIKLLELLRIMKKLPLLWKHNVGIKNVILSLDLKLKLG